MKIALSFIGCHRKGGVERLLLESANFLARRGHNVHVYANQFDPEVLHSNVTQHPVWAANRPSLLRLATYTRRCRSELSSSRAEVHGAFGVISPPGGIMNVQSVHRAWIEASQRLRKFSGRMRQICNPVHPLLLSLEKQYFGKRRYRKLTAPTEQVKQDLMRFYDVPEEDIVIVPNGFNAESLNPIRADALRPEMRKKFGYRNDDFVIIFVANELERKGFGPLLRAFASLDDPRLHLLAVVGRVSTEAYQDTVRRMGLGKQVRFVGAQNDLAPYYAAADILALPTQYEAWGLVIVEALACGTRVLTSRLAGASVAVKEGVNGELVDDPVDEREIAAKLECLLHYPRDQRNEVAASVSKFQWENVLPLYEQVLKGTVYI